VPAAQAASGAAATVSNPVVSEPRPADPGAANGAPGGSPDAAGAPPKSTAYPFTELEAKWQAHPCPARARLPRRGASRRGLPSVCCPVRQRQRVTTAACNSCVMPLCVWRPRTCCHATTGPCSRAPTGCEPRAMRASDWPACAQAASAGGSRGGATAHSVCQQREARRAGVLAGEKNISNAGAGRIGHQPAQGIHPGHVPVPLRRRLARRPPRSRCALACRPGAHVFTHGLKSARDQTPPAPACMSATWVSRRAPVRRRSADVFARRLKHARDRLGS